MAAKRPGTLLFFDSIFDFEQGAITMTFQGKRARPMASESGRLFEVSKVRIGTDGHISAVLWGEDSDQGVGVRVVAPVAEVVDAIHDGVQVVAMFSSLKNHLPERPFVIVEHEDGRECISFAGASSPGRNLSDMDSLDD